MFAFNIQEDGQTARIHLKGTLSIKDTRELKTRIKDLIETDKQTIIFDFKELSYLDSSGMGLLLYTYNATKATAQTVKIENISPEVRTIFAVANLLQVFQIV